MMYTKRTATLLILSIIIGIILLATGNVALFLRLKSRVEKHYDKHVSRFRRKKRGTKVQDPQGSEVEEPQVAAGGEPGGVEDSVSQECTGTEPLGAGIVDRQGVESREK